MLTLLLIDLCGKNGITYTRYIDDLTFSSSIDFKHLHSVIFSILNQNNFKINYRKTFYQDRLVITGIPVFNNYFDATKDIKIKAAMEDIFKVLNPAYSNYLKRIRQTNKNMIQKKVYALNPYSNLDLW